MAVTEGTFTTSTAAGYTFSYTVPSGANRCGTLIVPQECTVFPTDCEATLGGVALTKVPGTPALYTTRTVIYAFYILEADMPAAGAQTVLLTWTGGALVGRAMIMAVHTDAAQAAPSYYESNELATAPTADIASISKPTGSLVIAALCDSVVGVGTQGHTEAEALTERWDFSSSGSDFSTAGCTYISVGAGTDTVTFTKGTGNITNGCAAALVLGPVTSDSVADRSSPRGVGRGIARGIANARTMVQDKIGGLWRPKDRRLVIPVGLVPQGV